MCARRRASSAVPASDLFCIGHCSHKWHICCMFWFFVVLLTTLNANGRSSAGLEARAANDGDMKHIFFQTWTNFWCDHSISLLSPMHCGTLLTPLAQSHRYLICIISRCTTAIGADYLLVVSERAEWSFTVMILYFFGFDNVTVFY